MPMTYNDGCIKKILASEKKNIMLTTDLVNAALGLIGSDRIENPKHFHRSAARRKEVV